MVAEIEGVFCFIVVQLVDFLFVVDLFFRGYYSVFVHVEDHGGEDEEEDRDDAEADDDSDYHLGVEV